MRLPPLAFVPWRSLSRSRTPVRRQQHGLAQRRGDRAPRRRHPTRDDPQPHQLRPSGRSDPPGRSRSGSPRSPPPSPRPWPAGATRVHARPPRRRGRDRHRARHARRWRCAAVTQLGLVGDIRLDRLLRNDGAWTTVGVPAVHDARQAARAWRPRHRSPTPGRPRAPCGQDRPISEPSGRIGERRACGQLAGVWLWLRPHPRGRHPRKPPGVQRPALRGHWCERDVHGRGRRRCRARLRNRGYRCWQRHRGR